VILLKVVVVFKRDAATNAQVTKFVGLFLAWMGRVAAFVSALLMEVVYRRSY